MTEGNKLKDQVEILLDNKYTQVLNHDQAFEDSKKGCKRLLEGMKVAASRTAQNIKGVTTKLKAVYYIILHFIASN